MPAASFSTPVQNSRFVDPVSLQSQLNVAVSAHKALMDEYSTLNRYCESNEANLSKMREDMLFLDSLYQKAKAESEAAKQAITVERAVHAAEVSSLREQVSGLEQQLRDMKTYPTAAAGEPVPLQPTPEPLLVIPAPLAAAPQVESLQQAADQYRQTSQQVISEMREMHAAIKEVAAAHDQTLQSVRAEATAARELSIKLADTERQLLMERVEHEQRLRLEVEQRYQRELVAQRDEMAVLKATLEQTSKHRDELISEAKFQLEIISELRVEKAACKAELSALRHTTADGRTDVTTLRCPTPSSHAANHREDVDGDDAGNEISALQLELSQTKRKLEQATERLQRTANLDRELEESNDALNDMQERVQELQGDLATAEDRLQSAKRHAEELEAASERSAVDANLRVESLNRALAEQQHENTRLVEECDSLRTALRDMEQTLADALSNASIS